MTSYIDEIHVVNVYYKKEVDEEWMHLTHRGSIKEAERLIFRLFLARQGYVNGPIYTNTRYWKITSNRNLHVTYELANTPALMAHKLRNGDIHDAPIDMITVDKKEYIP